MISKENLGYSDALKENKERLPDDKEYMYGYEKGKKEASK